MEDFAQRLFSTLSSGEQQRVWIALGLAQETPILLLDEPTSHLDVRISHEILTLLHAFSRAGKTVVCALHDLNEAAAYADRIGLLGNGIAARQARRAPTQYSAARSSSRFTGSRWSRFVSPGEGCGAALGPRTLMVLGRNGTHVGTERAMPP